MKREIHCNHIKRGMSTTYIYDLIGSSLFLCNKCEKKLRKEIMEQDKIEEDMRKKFKRFLKRK